MGEHINPFEYISILVSIILGLGITQLLAGMADRFSDLKNTRFYWPHTIWVIILLYYQIQEWFIFFQLKNWSLWNVPNTLLVLSYPICMFITSRILLPPAPGNSIEDFKQHFYNSYQAFYFFFLLCVLSSILFNHFMLRLAIYEQIPLILLSCIAAGIVIAKLTKEWIHILLVTILVISTLIITWLEVDNWVIK